MFMHTEVRRRTAALGAALLTAALIVEAAEVAPQSLVLVAYENRAGGQPLLMGDYGAAAAALRGAASPDPQAFDTNRCVAYTMARQLLAARAACDAAVRSARGEAASASPWSAAARHQAQAAIAVAYSNRAVLHLLESDPQAAQRDLAAARALAPAAAFVTRNMNAMQGGENQPSQITAAALPAAASH